MDMVRQILLLAVLGLVLVAFTPLASTASAHQDGCQVAAHQGKTTLHLFCATSANTCFMNAQHADTEAHVICFMPEPQPCAVKAKTSDVRVVACTNHVGITDD